MKLLRAALIGVVLTFACFATIASAKTTEFQKVTFDEFFAKNVASLPLTLEIPGQYVHAEGVAVPYSTYSYWMEAGEVARAAKSKDLPVKIGYFYGKLSPNEAYDLKSAKFFSEDQAEAQLAAAGMELIERKRFQAKGYPVFAYIARAKNGAGVCSMFVAMLIDTNVLYISYRPPNNVLKAGRAVWNHMLDSLK